MASQGYFDAFLEARPSTEISTSPKEFPSLLLVIIILDYMFPCCHLFVSFVITIGCYYFVLCLLEFGTRYEEAKAKGTDNYDRDLEETIQRLIVECERKIQRALKRLEEEDAKAAIAISATEVTQVHSISPFFPSTNFIVQLKYMCAWLLANAD